MEKIELADDLLLPPAAVTESIMIIGRKGSGKTYTAGRLFEQMFKIGAQCVVLDPVGSYYGLRLSKNGKHAGLNIPVFGGDHGDIPLSASGGKLMAQTVVERNISCVIDLMNFRPSQRKEFSADFAEELLELKKRKRTPLHVFVEEARLFAPQVFKAKVDARMLDAFEQIVRLGRNYGLGVSLIDQRPQSVNKEVTSQTEVLIAHQLVEKLGRKEIEDWVRSKTVTGAEALDQLDQLHPGEAFIWSPGLLRKFARIKVSPKETYDTSATPKMGARADAQPRPLSSKELESLKASMAEVVQQAEAADPRVLRGRIAELEKLVRDLKCTNDTLGIAAARAEEKERKRMPQKVVDHVIEKPVVNKAMVIALERSIERGDKAAATVATISDRAGEMMKKAAELIAASGLRLEAELGKLRAALALAQAAPAPRPTVSAPAAKSVPTLPAIAKRLAQAPTADGELSGPEKRILESLAWLASIGNTMPQNEAVAFLAGYTPGGGAYANPKGALRAKGLLDYQGGSVFLTDAGRAVAPKVAGPLDTATLQRAVLDRLAGPEKRILEPLLAAYPNSLPMEELAEKSGYAIGGGAFANPRGRLRTLGLVDYPTKGTVRAKDLLFL